MLLEQYRPEIVLVLILFKLSSHLAFSMTNSSRSVCNGHGRMNNASIDVTCVCEAPYTGEECQLCNRGYYGDPSNGSPCYLSCSQHKLLSEFTHAGVGIDSDWLSRQGSFQNTYCLWFIAPDVSVSLSENESVIFNELFNRIRNHQSDSNHSINSNSSISFSHFNISLYFNTTDAAAADLSTASRQSNCFNETVLIYDGIPSHLISLDTVGADVSMTSSSLAHEYSNSNVSDSDSPSTGRLVRVFTGNELRNGHVTIQAPILTVVYFYKGFGADSANAHSTSAQTPVGFNLTVSVDDSEEEEEEVEVDGENGSQEDTHDEEYICLSPPCNCTQTFPLHYSTLIPSLTHTATSSLEYLTDSNATMRLPSSLERFHHSAVYDAYTDLLWLFGGVDLEGRVFNDLISINLTTTSLGADCDGGRCDGVEGGQVIEVMSVGGDGSDRPMGRYAHSTVLLPCSEESNSSKILLFGGFTSRHTPANDLWMFDTGSHEWTRLSNAPMARASHTAVLVGGTEMMVVIGGVREGVAISSRVMVYSLGEDQWELWETNTLDMPGVYGHSSAYDAVTHSILVYGGYLYSRPSPVLSSSLYSLDLTTRKWTQVVLNTDTVPSRLFHSMVLNGDFLLIYGGLVSEEQQQQHTVGLGGVCTSDDVILIDLRGESIKTIAINIQGDSRAAATGLPKLWGHQSTVRTDGQIIISGGMNTHTSDTISLLLAPTHLYCHLAQTQTDCVYMKPDCQTCVSRLDNIQFLGCYNVSDTQSNSLCNSSGGYFPDMPFPSSLRCSQVNTCEECLTMDVAISMGCLWCECNERCVSRQQECTCGDASSVSNSSTPDVCYLEVCRLASCEECTNHSQCRWLSIEIRRHMTRTNVINVSPNPKEWGCYDESIFETIIENLPKHTNNSLEVCPISCHHHTSCTTCVEAYSPNGGHLMCVWSSYRKECMSVDGIPLLCADGQCGDIVTDRCPQPCSQFSTCDTCLQDSRCLWLYDPESRDISCVDVTEPEELDDLNVNETLIFYLECPVCENNCSNHGVCQPNLTCVCDVGYIGPHCSVECLCNGHSYCANETEVGRRDCLQCLHNTQGVACHRCLPLTAGSAIDGGQCVPCSEYCHGNSEVCLTENEYLTLTHRNLTLSASVVGDYVLNGPSVEEGLCVDCGAFSRGPRCSSCADGYYNSNSNVEQEHVICIECACNGHDVGGCDEHTGICICQNNTFSQMCNDRPCNIRQQCNHCVSGYIGQPVNNGQCYKRLNIDTIDNFTLSANHTVSLALGPNYLYSDVDVHVTFVVVTGTLLIYSTTDNNAVKVATNAVSGTHEVRYDANSLLRISRESSQLYCRHDDAQDSLLRSIFHNDFFHGVVGSFSGGGGGGVHSEPVVSGSFKHEIIRKQISQSVSLSSGANIQQVIVSERQTLRIPHTSDDFLSSTHYFTILARGGNAMFFVYFEQNAPRLNLFVFFGAFFSSFILFSTIIISIWRVVHFISEWRRRRRARRRQQRRRHRPFSKVYVYFGDATIYKVKRSDPTKKLLDSSDKGKGTNKAQHNVKPGTKSSGETESWVIKPTRRDARRKNQSEKLPKQDVIELELKSTNTLAVANYDQSAVKPQQFVTQTKQHIFGEEIRMRPVCAQPTRDELTCVTTYIVRLPSKKHPICAGSSLVDYQRAGSNGTSGGNKKKRRVNFKRNNRCAPEVSHS